MKRDCIVWTEIVAWDEAAPVTEAQMDAVNKWYANWLRVQQEMSAD